MAPKSTKKEPLQTPKKNVVISIRKLFKNYRIIRGEVKVLRDIQLSIAQGEFVLILGPSGSGKSTLLNLLLGLELPSVGEIVIHGKDITKMSEDQRSDFRLKNIGIIFQKPDWIKALNVIENVGFPLAMADKDAKEQYQRSRELLDQVGMVSHMYFRPYQLSAGQQELVEFARALALRPAIIIADEPTGNLDSDTANKVMGMFKELNEKQNVTIVMVTHNIGHVSYASRTIYLKDGRILDGHSLSQEELDEVNTAPVI